MCVRADNLLRPPPPPNENQIFCRYNNYDVCWLLLLFIDFNAVLLYYPWHGTYKRLTSYWEITNIENIYVCDRAWKTFCIFTLKTRLFLSILCIYLSYFWLHIKSSLYLHILWLFISIRTWNIGEGTIPPPQVWGGGDISPFPAFNTHGKYTFMMFDWQIKYDFVSSEGI